MFDVANWAKDLAGSDIILSFVSDGGSLDLLDDALLTETVSTVEYSRQVTFVTLLVGVSKLFVADNTSS